MPVRTYSYKAWLAPEEASRALAAMREIREAYVAACALPVLNEAMREARTRLDQFWWPNRALVRDWLFAAARRRETPAPEARLGLGVLAGQLGAGRGRGLAPLQKSRVVSLSPEPVAVRGERPVYRLAFPLDSAGTQRVTLDFLLHRPVPADAELLRFLLVATPGRSGRPSWRLNLIYREAEPAGRTGGVIGGLDIGWRVEAEGLRVATLATPAGVSVYRLPPEFLARAHAALELSPEDREARRFFRWRQDLYRKMAADICRRVDVLHIEKLNLKRLTDAGMPRRNRRYVAPSLLIRAIKERAEKVGVALVEVAASNTSRICHQCGGLLLRRSSRLIWLCPNCGAKWDQDENAAHNISGRGPNT